MAKTGKKAEAKKLAKQQKRALRAEADKARFQSSDRKSISAIVGNREAQAVLPHVDETHADLAKHDPHTQPHSASQDNQTVVKQSLALNASVILAMAAGVFILMMIMVIQQIPGAETAARAFGGDLFGAELSPISDIGRVFLFLDILFPMFLGAGFGMLVASRQTRGNRPLVRITLSVAVIAVLADLSENALVFSAMNTKAVPAFQIIFTVVKYAGFALAGVLASAILPVRGLWGWIVHILLRFVFPVVAALAISKIGAAEFFGYDQKIVSAGIAGCFLTTILALAIYAAIMSDESRA